jgi:hypothetical protein
MSPGILNPRYSLTAFLLAVTLVALALGSVRLWQVYQKRADLAAVFGGEAGLSVLEKPGKVEAYRLDTSQSPPIDSEQLQDYPVDLGPVALSQQRVVQIQESLLHWSSYDWDDDPVGCILLYGVRLDFTRGNDRLQIMICFECDILSCWLNGQLAGGGDFDPIHAELVRIVKAIFPSDAEIQALK